MMEKRGKQKSFLIAACLILGLFVWMKMTLTGVLPDEEYQITMSYRLAQGDGLFYLSWDTIQTSGFINFFLIKIYQYIAGTEGLVIFLRTCGLMLQLGTSAVLYHRIRRKIQPLSAFLIACICFFSFPKLIAAPDFSNMQQWFSILMLCFLWGAQDIYRNSSRLSRWNLIAAAVCLCGVILSQACFILVPILAVGLCLLFPKSKVRSNLIFFGTCGITGGIYLLGLLIRNGWQTTLNSMQNILSGDMTHASGANLLGQSILVSLLKNLLTLVAWMGVVVIVSLALVYVIQKIRKQPMRRETVFVTAMFLSTLVTLYEWIVRNTGYDGMKLYIPMCLVFALTEVVIFWKRDQESRQEQLIPLLGIVTGIGIFVNVLFISNVPLINNLCFLSSAVIWSLILLIVAWERKQTPDKLIRIILMSVGFTMFFGTFFTLPSSPAGNHVFTCKKAIESGPYKGVRTSNKIAAVNNSVYAEVERLVPQHSNMLLVTNSYENTLLNYCYLIKESNVCHYSVNSTPTFSMKLEEYWKKYPQKEPEIILVNKSTYTTWEWDWIMSYLTYYLGYERIEQTEYADFYFR